MPAATQPYILIADDDPEDLFFFTARFCLKYPGFRVEVFSDGDQALSFLAGKIGGELPRLILLDYKMPLMSGIEVLRKLSVEPRFQGLPIAIWTSSERTSESEDCRKFGAAGYFVKPNSEEELDLIITKIGAILENPVTKIFNT